MAFQYINRRGDVYHLQTKMSRKGAPGYSFTRKLTGAPVEKLPAGYEVYENPDNAQVFARKIKPSDILPEERESVESAIRRLAKRSHFIVDMDGDSLVIYLPDCDDDLSRITATLSLRAGEAKKMEERLLQMSRYSKMMRFTLMDNEARRFRADRWCFLGSIDDWFPLDFDKSLPDLLKKYAPHLGKESFFELM